MFVGLATGVSDRNGLASGVLYRHGAALEPASHPTFTYLDTRSLRAARPGTASGLSKHSMYAYNTCARNPIVSG